MNCIFNGDLFVIDKEKRFIFLYLLLCMNFMGYANASDFVDSDDLDHQRGEIEARVQSNMFHPSISHIGNHFKKVLIHRINTLEYSIKQRRLHVYELDESLHQHNAPGEDQIIKEKMDRLERKTAELNDQIEELRYLRSIENEMLPADKPQGRKPYFDDHYNSKIAMHGLFLEVLFAGDTQIRILDNGKKIIIAGTADDNKKYIFVLISISLHGDLTIRTGHPRANKTIFDYD